MDALLSMIDIEDNINNSELAMNQLSNSRYFKILFNIYRNRTNKKIENNVKKLFIEHIENGLHSIKSAAKIFAIPYTTAYGIYKKSLKNSDETINTHGGKRNIKITEDIKNLISNLIEERPDLTLKKIADIIANEKNVVLSISSISKTLTKLNFTFKLLRYIPVARNLPEKILARYNYAVDYNANSPNNRQNIIWLDETGFNLHIRRKFGRAKKGEIASIIIPTQRGKNISIAAAMSKDGPLLKEIKDGPYNANLFTNFLQKLINLLRNREITNCWFIMDNAKFHYSIIVRNIVEKNMHALKFLPAYLPMLNPIKSLFFKWKNLVKTDGLIYSRNTLLNLLNTTSLQITNLDCEGWIRESERNIGLSLINHIFI